MWFLKMNIFSKKKKFHVKVVTAAHCVFRITDTSPFQVRVGSVEWDKGGQLVDVARYVRHRDYNDPTLLNNDIAVVILSEALTLGPSIGRVVLPDKFLNLPAGTFVHISGYGSTSLGSNNPDVLHYVTVPIVDQAQCKKAYVKYPGTAKLTDNMFCAGFYGVGGKDSCRGDSGGFDRSIYTKRKDFQINFVLIGDFSRFQFK